jgi:hypothetical protein
MEDDNNEVDMGVLSQVGGRTMNEEKEKYITAELITGRPAAGRIRAGSLTFYGNWHEGTGPISE